MKKIIAALCLILILSTSFLFGCKKNSKLETIRLNEVTHSVFYAPLYIAINEGYFENEGYKIELTNGGGADKSMAAVLSGEADIGLMGPEAALYVVSGGAQNHPVIFGQLTQKDGSFLVSKQQNDNFKFSDLIGKEIIAGRRGGVPAMVLENILLEQGLHPGDALSDSVDMILNLDIQFNLIAAAFEASTDAYCTLFEPTASQYEKENKGYIVAALGDYSGEIPYTAFMAKKNYLESNPERATNFLKAIIKGYNFIIENEVNTVVNALKPSFTSTSDDLIKIAIESYKRIAAWCETPVMKQQQLDRLQDIIIANEKLTHKIDFNTIVDNSYAQNAIESLS